MSICVTCSEQGKDCCHLRGNDAYKFGLTVSDIKRISRATGLQPYEFADLERMPKFPLREIAATHPNLERMYPHQTRVALKFEGEDRACYFWKEGQGCTLSMDQKPRFCALFPAWYEQKGDKYLIDTKALAGGNRCMAVDEGRDNPKRVLKVIGQTDAQTLHLAKLSDRELENHANTSLEEIEKVYNGENT